MQTESDLFTPAEMAATPIGDKSSPVYGLIDQMNRGTLRKPPHQREDDVWEEKQRAALLIGCLTAGRLPLGTIAIYQLVDGVNPISPFYLNDGLQRLTTFKMAREQPAKFGLDAAAVESIIQHDITVQHRHYRNADEAMRAFQWVNLGTTLTPYELAKGHLAYWPGARWDKLLAHVEEAMTEAALLLSGGGKQGKGRATEHKYLRHDWALWYRYLTAEALPVTYDDVGKTSVRTWFMSEKPLLEQSLRDYLLQVGFEVAQERTQKFRRFVTERVKWLQVKREILGGRPLSEGLWRWFLDFAAYAQNARVPIKRQEEFMELVIRATGGGTQWTDAEGGHLMTFKLANLGDLKAAAKHAGMPDLWRGPKRIRRPKLMPGLHYSHVDNVSENGEGPVIVEPGMTNLGRGMNSIPPEEQGNGHPA